MGTDRGVQGGGGARGGEREVVARGKQGEGDVSFRACYMMSARGCVRARTTTLWSARCMRCVL